MVSGGEVMASIVWVAFCGECDYQLTDSEARAEECPECKFNEDINEEVQG